MRRETAPASNETTRNTGPMVLIPVRLVKRGCVSGVRGDRCVLCFVCTTVIRGVFHFRQNDGKLPRTYSERPV